MLEVPVSMFSILSMLGLFILGLVLLYLARGRDRPLSWQLSWGRLWFMLLGLACLLLGGFLAGAIIFALELWFIILIALVVVLRRAAWNTNRDLWEVVAGALRHNLPLPPVVEAALVERGTAVAHRGFLSRIRAGASIEDLPRQLRLRRWERAALALAAKTGRWKESLQAIAEDQLAIREVQHLFLGRLVLLLFLAQAIPLATIAFRSYFVLHEITEGFGVSQIQLVLAGHWPIPAFFSDAATLYTLCQILALLFCLGFVVYWLAGYGVTRDLMPGMECSYRSRSQILLLLSEGTAAGRPLIEILDVLIDNPPRWFLGRRLLNALDSLYCGEDHWRAMQKAGLISLADAEVLAASQVLGNLPLSLRTLATLYRDRYAAWLRRWAIFGYLVLATLIVFIVLPVYGVTFGTLLSIIGSLL